MSSKSGKAPALEKMPSLRSDAEAEAFVDSADLSRYDLSGFKPMRFEFEPFHHAASCADAGCPEGQSEG